VNENAEPSETSFSQQTNAHKTAAVSMTHSHDDAASNSHQDSNSLPSESSFEKIGEGKRKREDQGAWEKERKEDRRKRNAVYSKRNYYRKRQKFDNIQTQAYLLEEQNFNLRKENKRLEELLAAAREKVSASVDTNNPCMDSRLSTASLLAAPPVAANHMHGLFASSFLGQSSVEPNLMTLQQMIHSVAPSPPAPNFQADLRLAAYHNPVQQALSALGTSSASRAPRPLDPLATQRQVTLMQERKSISPHVLNEAVNLSQLRALQPQAQASTFKSVLQLGNRAAGRQW